VVVAGRIAGKETHTPAANGAVEVAYSARFEPRAHNREAKSGNGEFGPLPRIRPRQRPKLGL
jgi:hypothetical protein